MKHLAARRVVVLGSALLIATISLGLVEVGLAISTFMSRGQIFPKYEIKSNNSFTLNENSDCTPYTSLLAPHPYLGFVRNPDLVDCYSGIWGINSFGFPFDDPPPSTGVRLENSVLLVGGSVAAQLGASRLLERELNDCFSEDWKVFTVADGAWKQPQQVIAQTIYGSGVKYIFSLEGFNEHYMLNPSKIDFAVPAANFATVTRTLPWTTKSVAKLVRFVETPLTSLPVFDRSQTLGMIASFSRRFVESRYSEDLFALGARQWTHDQQIEFETRLNEYGRYIKLMGSIGQVHDQQVHVFVQPVPAIGKKLTDEEIAVVGNLAYGELYENMANSLLNIQMANLHTYSLLQIFNDKTDSLYADAVHLGLNSSSGDSQGYRLIAEEMVKLFSTTEGLSRNCS